MFHKGDKVLKKQPLIEVAGISKFFGAVQALKKVDLRVGYNEVLGLVGDNAAGKSTLMKVLTGAYIRDEGEVFLEGEKVNFTHPRESRARGIEMVYQDLALVNNIDIAGNIFLGEEPKRTIFGPIKIMDRRKMEAESEGILRKLKIGVRSVKTKVGILSGGQQKAVAIGKSFSHKAKLIIMDEPTAALGVRAVNKLLDLVRQIKEEGISVIFISHRLQDIFSIGDRITVLREGHVVGDKKISETTPDEIANLMVGADLIKF